MTNTWINIRLNKALSRFLMLIVITSAIITIPLSCLAGIPSDAHSSKTFTEVAKQAIPAVVSIKSHIPTSSSMGMEPFDMLGDDFWQFFFGMPHQRRHRTEKQPQQIGQGSGFIIKYRDQFYILTNNHVVRDAEKVIVALNSNEEYKAEIVGTDPSTDIAVLKINVKDLPYLTLGDSDATEIAESVIAIGNPLGLQASVSAGIISAKNRKDLDIAQYEEFFQTDAAINRGNSGGPLVDLKGKVIGMNTAIASVSGGPIGIGFAIPSNMIQHIMNQLIETGHVIRGYLGVGLQRVTPDLAQAFKLEKTMGALVAEIDIQGPSFKKIEEGDLILKLNGKPVDSSSELRKVIAQMSPGQKATLTVKRKEKLLDIDIIIGSHPENLVQDKSSGPGFIASYGIQVQDLTPEVAKKLKYDEEKGVLISSVTPGSIAAQAGLQPGQLIISVNQKSISSKEEFFKVIQENATDGALLHIKSGRSSYYVVLKSEK